ncbi:conserved hypothetical protein, membrane [Candidatus Thiomargarita nelsonii]|uniref:SGNH hydrolase-type esterase domain-containing protein n=1 Tax=Candidatus Thiomargarita nelsonii TaxID=1003181 RepID=A0A0A6P1A1_9GAMM|nr:conserved hypothetical protein, membrane [Candidatus Thiomargarita nelsonii]
MLFYIFLTALSIIASFLILKFTIAPYIWLCLLWIIFFLACFFRTNRTLLKALFVYPIAILLTLGIFETYLWFKFQQKESMLQYENKDYSQPHDILGYAPQKDIVTTSRNYHGNELLYDVTYSINPYGLRVTPEPTKKDKKACILFFGGSFTFGEGVNDEQSMPYLVGLKSGYRTYNFGFHGYGPHQMLAALEHDLVEETIDCMPTHIIYQVIMGHVSRSAGHSRWDKHGPKYILGEDGKVKYQGHFDDQTISSWLGKVRDKSTIYRKIFQNGSYIFVNKQDVELFIQIVNSAKKISKHLFKESLFHVILWDPSPSSNDTNVQHYNMIMKGFNKNHIRVHLVSDILPSYKNKVKYAISPHDWHPNYLAHDLISYYIVDTIINSH